MGSLPGTFVERAEKPAGLGPGNTRTMIPNSEPEAFLHMGNDEFDVHGSGVPDGVFAGVVHQIEKNLFDR